jgi:hypothetical protein
MKCFACGYDDTEQKPVKTERICISGTGKRKRFIRIGPTTLMDNTVYGVGGYTHIPLYACPNCGTVRMDNGC